LQLFEETIGDIDLFEGANWNEERESGALTWVLKHALKCVSISVFSRLRWSIAYPENSPPSRRTTHGDYKDKLGTCSRKNLKRLKDYKSGPWCMREPVRRSLAIIYEFGAPKKAVAAVGSRWDWVKCALRISNRSAKRIKYFMENDLFNGPYGGMGSLHVYIDL